MRDLMAKIEKLDGPDREVDFWISVRFPMGGPTRHTDAELQADIDLVGIENMVIDAPYTASLDAAVALAGRVLGEDETLDLLTEVVSEANDDTVNGTISSLPIALVLATLKAKEAQDG